MRGSQTLETFDELDVLPESTIDLISHGRKVILTEAAALGRLAEGLDDAFAEAVKTIVASRMRVVVTGMGKSGHVARKIAATFAATGTPAIFVHPAEAAHGDLGMIIQGDVLLVLSNSGNTAELRPIMGYARTLGCTIISIAARAKSPVMVGADIGLLLPQAQEACTVNIAPTTSTTMMLALGDALAVTVMGVRGVSRERIETLHPGGSIGRQVATVADIMRTGDAMPLVPADAPMREVLVTMTAKSLGIAGVVDEAGRLVGVITDGDLRRHIDILMTSNARAVMSVRPRTIQSRARANDALTMLSASRITALFVVEDERPDHPVGIVHIHDFTSHGVA